MTAPVVEVVPVTELRAGDVVVAALGSVRPVTGVTHTGEGSAVRHLDGVVLHNPGSTVRRLVTPGEVRAADLKPGDRIVVERTVVASIPAADGQRLVVFQHSDEAASTLTCGADRMLRRAP